MGKFLAAHPETKRFLEAEKPSPVSFATAKYWGVNAYVFTNEKGGKTTVRYRYEPLAGVHSYSNAELEGKSGNYLYEELESRLKGDGNIVFKLKAQVAAEGDRTDDATVLWAEEREVVELGEVRVERVEGVESSLEGEKRVIFDPVPRVEGIESSGDPLLDVRATLYLLSGRERREAGVGK